MRNSKARTTKQNIHCASEPIGQLLVNLVENPLFSKTLYVEDLIIQQKHPTLNAAWLSVPFGNNLISYIPHKWIVLFARFDWLTRRWLAKYYSPPSSGASEILKFPTICRFIVTNKVILSPIVIQIVWYILKQLLTSVSMKVVDIYLHFGEQMLNRKDIQSQTTFNLDDDICQS